MGWGVEGMGWVETQSGEGRRVSPGRRAAGRRGVPGLWRAVLVFGDELESRCLATRGAFGLLLWRAYVRRGNGQGGYGFARERCEAREQERVLCPSRDGAVQQVHRVRDRLPLCRELRKEPRRRSPIQCDPHARRGPLRRNRGGSLSSAFRLERVQRQCGAVFWRDRRRGKHVRGDVLRRRGRRWPSEYPSCALGTTCETGSATPVCAAYATAEPGAPCTAFCTEGYVCVAPSLLEPAVCRLPAKLGEACAGYADCEAGTTAPSCSELESVSKTSRSAKRVMATRFSSAPTACVSTECARITRQSGSRAPSRRNARRVPASTANAQ